MSPVSVNAGSCLGGSNQESASQSREIPLVANSKRAHNGTAVHKNVVITGAGGGTSW